MSQMMTAGRLVGKRVDEDRGRVRHEQHVGLVNSLEAADAGSVRRPSPLRSGPQ